MGHENDGKLEVNGNIWDVNSPANEDEKLYHWDIGLALKIYGEVEVYFLGNDRQKQSYYAKYYSPEEKCFYEIEIDFVEGQSNEWAEHDTESGAIKLKDLLYEGSQYKLRILKKTQKIMCLCDSPDTSLI